MKIFRGLSLIALLTATNLVAASPTALSAASTPTPLSFYVASQSQGILHVAFDPSKDENSSLSIISVNTNAGYQPNWLKSYNNIVYSISRTYYPDNASTPGGLFAFSKPPPGELNLFSMESSDGLGGVAIDVSPDGRILAAANIDGSTVSIHPLTEDGYIQPSTYVFSYNLTVPGPGWNESQIQANPHHAAFDPSGEFMFVADRGSDRVYVYAVDGPQNFTQIYNITLEKGTGPRHFAFREYNETRTYMYLVSELDNTVRVFALDRATHASVTFGSPDSLQVTLKQIISTISAGHNRTAPYNRDMTADIAISNDGKYAYAANRNTVTLTSDNIAVFSIDPRPDDDATHLTFLGRNETYGKIPRHFALSTDPVNRYIAVANEYSQVLVVLERDATSGFATNRKGLLALGEIDLSGKLGPVCVLWD